MSHTPEHLINVLQHLQTADNTVRSHAEDELNTLVNHNPDFVITTLAQLSVQHPDQQLRAYTAVLFRRIALRNRKIDDSTQVAADADLSVWAVLSPSIQAGCKTLLLQSLSSESVAVVRNKICDTISELAKHLFTMQESWPELLGAVFECTKSPSADHRDSALRIISSVPSLITEQDPSGVAHVFAASLQDGVLNIRASALKAIVSYMVSANKAGRSAVQPLIPQLLSTIPEILNQDEVQAMDCFSCLIELAESYPKTFRSVMPQLVQLLVGILKNKSIEASTRHTALEILITIGEYAPAMVRKFPEYASTLIPIMLEWMADLEDEPSWYTTDVLEDDDNEEDYVVGEQTMDRLARNLGGASVLPVTFNVLSAMLGAQEWQRRHAALMAISAIGEGCKKQMEADLKRVVDLVVPYTRDPHPRVRYAALNTIGQLSTDFAPLIQSDYHHVVLESLATCMDDAQYPRVQAHAAAALVNFSEEAEKDVMAPYLDHLFPRLLTLLDKGKTYVQEQAITSMATVAESAKDKFAAYYNSIMPLLLNVMKHATTKEFRLLRGKAMECASLVALAVGKDVFLPHASEFIEILRVTQQSITDSDDPQAGYLPPAWARVCKVLGQDFLPFLDIVMPPVLEGAKLKPDFAVLDVEDDIEEKFGDEEGWEFLQMEGQRVGIKTSVLDDKCTSVEMLVSYAAELGAGFHTYVPQVMEIVLPLVTFYFHDGVREAAAACITQLILSWKKANYPQDQILALWHKVLAKTLETMKDEADPVFLANLYASFYESLEAVGPMSMTADQLALFINGAQYQLLQYFERNKERAERRKDADHDEEDEETLLENEEDDDILLSELSRAIHEIFKQHGQAFLPYFEIIIPIVNNFLVNSDSSARQWAICVYDDLIEFTGPASWVYHTHFLSALSNALGDKSSDVRQAAAYGVGVMAQFGGESFAQTCCQALNALFGIVNASDARSEANVVATENAISAIGKICHFHGQHFDVNTALAHWFQALPIVHDEDEAPHTYTYLLDLLEGNHPAILGEGHANLPKLVPMFAQVLMAGILSAELEPRMSNSIRVILTQCDDATKGALWQSLTDAQRQFLQQKGFV
ncbi:importin subunit beta-3 [Polychytrium aggregatum]|uniref:importin subunit beta-3 n=1 Tax=Polychytrium aggregatum TaxID=110093 RepID=UPI0022FEE4B3|nr:importin subunit beta-3 [Polychytrium aggregatum]KAI9190858.1 importin subunit beta-3 [Polychytrium aggregatum]